MQDHDDLQLLCFSEVVRGKILRKLHDSILGLQCGGLMVCREVLDGLHLNGSQVLADVIRGWLNPGGEISGSLFFLLDT